MLNILQISLYCLCFWATLVSAVLPRDKCCSVNRRFEACAGCDCKMTQKFNSNEQWTGSCTNEVGLEIGTFAVGCLGGACRGGPVLTLTTSKVVAGFALYTECLDGQIGQSQIYQCPAGLTANFQPVDCAANGRYKVTVARIDPASDNCL